MSNALVDAASPYLRQHADNPVHWVQWGPAAFADARARGVPVIVSIGYATCHWCHVMAHECFEDATIADTMNRNFVCIKVDREELPEVDEIYMDAVRALTGRGGWPLNAFVDHDGRPFFVGTWFSPPRWRDLLKTLSDLWRDDRNRIDEAAAQLTEHLATLGDDEAGVVPDNLSEMLTQRLETSWDEEHPGFARAPKFPPSQLVLLLLQSPELVRGGLAMIEATLEAMQDGGIHDRIGGGFHRYSTDAVWRVPHFEKMLYDNAQLAAAFAIAASRFDRPDFMRTATAIGDHLLRDMRVCTPHGALVGYATAEDADDGGGHGGEGGYYALPPSTLPVIVGPSTAPFLAECWDLTDGTPHIGTSGHPEPVASHIPHPRGAPLAKLAEKHGYPSVEALRLAWECWLPRLRAARDPALRPMRDDKVLTDLNGLALIAFSTLARLSPTPGEKARFGAATAELANALANRHVETGLLRLGAPSPRPAFITDYGLYALGLVEAFRALGAPALIERAVAVVDEAVARLAAPDGGFFTTPADRTDLVRRSRENADGAHPAGQNALALACVRLFAVTEQPRFEHIARGIIASRAALLARAPDACATLVQARVELARGHTTVVIAGDDSETKAMLDFVRSEADMTIIAIESSRCAATGWPALIGRNTPTTSAWVCRDRTCLMPVHDITALRSVLGHQDFQSKS